MRAPYARIAKEVLPDWEISLAFVDTRTARDLNKQYRGKEYVPNVLSYAVGKQSGEIIICKEVARTQAPSYNLRPTAFYLLLFIHALLHLEGGRHGTTMERREQALLKIYGSASRTYGSSHRNRNRHRHVSGEDRRRRRTS